MLNVQIMSSLVLNRQATSLITKGTFPNVKMIGLRVAKGYKSELPKLLQSLQQLSHLNKLVIVLLRDRNNTSVEDWLEAARTVTEPGAIQLSNCLKNCECFGPSNLCPHISSKRCKVNVLSVLSALVMRG